MKTLKKVNITYKHVKYVPDYLEKNILYISNEFKTVIHSCLCGCGTEVVTPLGESEWNLEEKNKKITMKPSILNGFSCKSHYIIINSIANFV